LVRSLMIFRTRSASAAHSCNGEAIGIGAKLGDVEGIIFAGSLSAL
jgi:hypothetical protein